MTQPGTQALSDPQLVNWSKQLVAELPGWVDPIGARLSVLNVQLASRFEADDKAKPVEPPSVQVFHLLRSAHDHLRMLADAVSVSGIPPLAGFTLIRSAIEASALASWLMSGGTLSKRVMASIRLTWNNRQNTEAYTRRFDIDPSIVTDWLRDELNATKNLRPQLRSSTFEREFPHFTDLVMEADKRLPQKMALSGIDAWRACSGIAHSNASFAAGAITRTETSDKIEVTVKFTTLAMMLEPSKRHLEHALGLAELHSAPSGSKSS